MKITQAYISKSVMDFPWLEKHGLRPYDNPNEPAVFFGMYRPEDYGALCFHKGFAVVRWCGVDALHIHQPNLFKGENIANVSPFKLIKDQLETLSIKSDITLPNNIHNVSTPKKHGEKIYVYAPSDSRDYYGGKIIDQLIEMGYDILEAKGGIPRYMWDSGIGDMYYDQCYIGLGISKFVGGGASIMELGLKGRRCITNILPSPNALPWTTIDDIVVHLEREKAYVTGIEIEISEATKAFMGDDNWLNTEYYGKEYL
jgi:hypothetical protein